MPAATIAYGDCRVRVSTSEAADLVWLLEFVGPDVDVREGGPVDREVALEVDADRFAALQSLGPHPSRTSIATFALDGQMVTLPRWSGPDDTTSVFDPEWHLLYERGPGTRTRIVAPPGHVQGRVALLRVLREVVTAWTTVRGCLVLHGASIAWKGRGVVLAGAKQAGKTTLVCHLLLNSGATYVANDRTLVSTGSLSLPIRGMPTIVSVRGSSLEHLPALAAPLAASGFHHRLTMEESVEHPDQGGAGRLGSWSLTPAQFTRLLGVRRSSDVPLGAVLFPEQTGERGGITLVRLTKNEATRRLRAAIFRADEPSIVGDLFAEPDRTATSVEARAALCHRRLADVPCYACRLGLDAYADPQSALDVLNAL